MAYIQTNQQQANNLHKKQPNQHHNPSHTRASSLTKKRRKKRKKRDANGRIMYDQNGNIIYEYKYFYVPISPANKTAQTLPKLKYNKNNNNKPFQIQQLTQSECNYKHNNNQIIQSNINSKYPQQLNDIYKSNEFKQKRKTSYIEQQSYFYKKSRHIKAWRQRWTVIKYHQTNKQYILYTYKNKDKLKNPTETIIINENTDIKYSKCTDNKNDNAKYGMYLIKIMNKSHKPQNEMLEFRTSDCILSINWMNAINLIIHLCEMNALNLTTIPNYIYDNKLYFVIYGYLHTITNDFIPLEVVNTVFYFSKYDRISFSISPKYCLMHRVRQEHINNLYDQNIDLIELFSGNMRDLGVCFDEIRDNSGYCFVKNKTLPPYVHQTQCNIKVDKYRNNKYNLIFRMGGNDISYESVTTNECELIAFTASFNDCKSQYYHLPSAPINIASTSIIFHHNLLFLIGGIIGKTYKQRQISNKIYGLDLYNEYNHGLNWRDVTVNLPLLIPKYGCSSIFLTDSKLLMIAGSSSLKNKANTLNNKDNTVELYEIDGMVSSKKNTLLLAETKRSHLYGGCCKGIGYDNSKICIGSNIYVELYDANKNYWHSIGIQTNFNHIYSRLWCHEKNKNILFIASPNNNTIEWCDIRQNKWILYGNQNIFKSTNLSTNNALFV
eukprot:444858_1